MEKNDLRVEVKMVALGGSAGSLEVILAMLHDLKPISFPMLIVLHRKNTSDSTLTELLKERSAVRVKEAEEKEPLEKGTIYIAPADYHLLVESDQTVSLDDSEKVNFSRPSIDVSFESVARVYGAGAVGMLLSGGNADGVAGLQAIKRVGGLVVVQDPSTAGIGFMPEQAVNKMVIDQMLKTFEFADFINRLG